MKRYSLFTLQFTIFTRVNFCRVNLVSSLLKSTRHMSQLDTWSTCWGLPWTSAVSAADGHCIERIVGVDADCAAQYSSVCRRANASQSCNTYPEGSVTFFVGTYDSRRTGRGVTLPKWTADWKMIAEANCPYSFMKESFWLCTSNYVKFICFKTILWRF